MSEAVMGIWLSLVRLAGTGGGEESLTDGEQVPHSSPPRTPAAKEADSESILLPCKATDINFFSRLGPLLHSLAISHLSCCHIAH